MHRLSILKSVFFISIYIVLLLFFVGGTVVSLRYDTSKQGELATLQDIYNKEKNENSQLQKEYQYYNSQLYVQKEAIDNLNMADKNATLVVVNPPSTKDGRRSDLPSTTSAQYPNWKQWWNLVR